MTKAMRRFAFSPSGNLKLPLLIESIGYNPNQEKITRPQGYPWYHWLQCEEGEGMLYYEETEIVLKPYSGILLPPNLPHHYKASTSQIWSTYYLTFGGTTVSQILSAFNIKEPAIFHWDAHSPFAPSISTMLTQIDQTSDDRFGLETSVELYRFLGYLSKLNQDNRNSFSRNIEKLTPLLKWMEANYANPDVGLDDLAEVLGISGRHLSKLFHLTFHLAPYTYFVQMRIHKAKEKLASESQRTVAEIANATGFRDSSHFVATFRKHTGVTPQQFKRLHA